MNQLSGYGLPALHTEYKVQKPELPPNKISWLFFLVLPAGATSVRGVRGDPKHLHLYCEANSEETVYPGARGCKPGSRNSGREKIHQCHLCHYSSRFISDVRRHIRIHTGERPFKCSVCSSAFNVRQNLKTHMRTHTGDKPFLCAYCPNAFSRRTLLKEHVKRHHSQSTVCKASPLPPVFTG